LIALKRAIGTRQEHGLFIPEYKTGAEETSAPV